MPKRISKEEFDQVMAGARAAYLRDIEAAGSDSGKVDLAAKKLNWAEEEARDAFNQRSGLYKFFDSIPLLGKPIAIILDNLDRGIAQHGRFWGSLRGLFIGVVIAAALVVLSEGIPPFYELGRQWIDLHYFSHIAARMNSDASAAATKELNEPYYQRHPEERPEARKKSSTPSASESERPEGSLNPIVVHVPAGGNAPTPASETVGPRLSEFRTLKTDTAFVLIPPDEFENAHRITNPSVAGILSSRAGGLDEPTIARVLPPGTEYQLLVEESGNPVLVHGGPRGKAVVIKTKDGRAGIVAWEAASSPKAENF